MRSRAATLLLVAWAAVVLADESTNEVSRIEWGARGSV